MLTLVRRSLKPALDQCVLISYSLEALVAARQQGWPRLGAVIDRWDEHRQELIAEIGPAFLFCDVDGLPPEGQLGIDGMKLVVFEVADASLALALAARGVDFIETFAVGEMLQEFSRLAPSG
jgi:glycerophosphoryl diester phosphodiesterase